MFSFFLSFFLLFFFFSLAMWMDRLEGIPWCAGSAVRKVMNGSEINGPSLRQASTSGLQTRPQETRFHINITITITIMTSH
jgi:hypothetical protein